MALIKTIQKYRFATQTLCFILTIIGFFTNFKITILVILCLTLLSGVFYCGWICPYGFMQDLGQKLGKLLRIKKIKMPKAIQKVLVFTRYLLLGLVLFIASDIIFGIMSFDPRANFGSLLLGNIASIAAITAMAFFVLVSLFFERPFCNYLCFEGAKYGLISSLKLFTIKRDASKCVGCKKCDKACPMNIEVSKCNQLRSPQCINCFQCVSDCPVKDTLSYGRINFTTYEIRRYLMMILILSVGIISFIGYTIYNNTNASDTIKSAQTQDFTQIPPLAENEDITYSDGVSSTSNGVVSQDSDTPPVDDTSSESEEITITDDSAKVLGDAAGITDGVYTGQGEGFKGPITVEVTVQDEQIVAVEVIESRDDRKWFQRALQVIPDEIIETQSTDVDAVSRATYSSLGIINGVKDALENAK